MGNETMGDVSLVYDPQVFDSLVEMAWCASNS